jgi:hypothetical protein
MGKRTTGRRGRPVRKQPAAPRLPVDVLALYRAQREGDSVAAAAWARLKDRAAELMAQGVARVDALDIASAEL